MTVTLFHRVIDEYRHKARENKFMVRDFVYNPDDVSRIAPLIAKIKRRRDGPEQTAKKIVRAVLEQYGADKAKVDDLFE